MEESDGKTSVMDRVICPWIRAAANCTIPLNQSCQMSCAKQHQPNVKKSKAIPEEVGVVARDKYEMGDFVSPDQYIVKTPGCLPIVLSQESHTNKLHGGTIFRDAALKYIHMSNQVSLGAGETISFKEWLWEATQTSVKHYHSNNEVFTAHEFQEAYAEEKKTQTFSGVGAQHQNAEAELAIQTIMYMTRLFMVYTAVNWGEDGLDDITLWSFAMDHVTWLYNRIPQWFSSITPLKMVTQNKTDHCDLMQTHVWGCPVYVLEASLQDSKKLPKWNK